MQMERPADTNHRMPIELLHAYVEQSEDCVSFFDKDGKTLYCNPAHQKVFGFSPEELQGLHFTELPILVPEQQAPLQERFSEIMEGLDLQPLSLPFLRRDGQKVWIEARITALRAGGKIVGVQSVGRDITRWQLAQLHLTFEQILSNIASRFVNMPDHLVDGGIEKALKEISEFIGADRGTMFLLTDQGRSLSISHEWARPMEFSQKQDLQHVPAQQFSHIARRLEKLEDVLIRTAGDVADEADGEKQWFEQHGFHALFFVPLLSEQKLAGTLGFARKGEYQWPEQYGNLLRSAATILYSAIKRKELNRHLRLAEFTLDSYSECVIWVNSGARVIDVNHATTTVLGYTKEEMLQMHVYDYDVNADEKRLDEFWGRIRKIKSTVIESVHRRKDGGTFPVEISANYLKFEGQEYVVAFARDITERKAAEKAIRESEYQYRRIFENVGDMFYEASLEGRLLNATPSVENVTGYRRAQIIGKAMEEFYYHPEDRAPLLKTLHEKGEVRDYELMIKDAGGQPIPCSLSSRVIRDEEGRPERIVGSITDMRQRKKDEEQIRQLTAALAQSPVGVIIADPDSRILYANDSFLRFAGMDLEEIIGSKPFDITRGQVPAEEYQDLWDSVRKGKVWKHEMEYSKRDGTKTWLAFTVSPIFADGQKVGNVVAIVEEIKERKQYEENLKRAKEAAERSDHLKSAFLANMSHEIRTPMNAILGFSSLLKEGGISREQSEYYIDIINTKGKDLLKIISDIIDISRIEAGDLYIRKEPVRIYRFMRELYDEMKEETRIRSRTDLQFRLSKPGPERKIIVNTDPARLKQVLVNLIQNAIKFTPDGYIEIGFELKAKHEIRFFVKDTGIGIPPEKLRIIFERFRQLDDTHTREYGGTGLGLSICKNIIEQMGSELKVRSSEGQGSEFHFSLKYIKTHREEEPGDKKGSEIPTPRLHLKGKRILIVEDDGSSYLFLETLLSQFGAELIWAKNGKQAIEMISEDPKFDMILMDIRMPEMNGLEATRSIRKNQKEIPIIAQTAYAQVADRKMALESGCNDYISKPVSPPELYQLLGKYFD